MVDKTPAELKHDFFLKLDGEGTFTSEDQLELQHVLGNKAFRRALRHILMDVNNLAIQLVKFDMTTEEGHRKALKLQGLANGKELAIDALVSLAFDKETIHAN